jgi:predicted DNA-binding transcriptional regulator AlpA
MIRKQETREERPKRYLTMRQLCQRWGGASFMFVERKMKKDPRFPRPIRPGGSRLRLFDEEQIETYERISVGIGRD